MGRHEDDKDQRAELDDQRHPLGDLGFLAGGRIFVDEFAMDVAGVEIGGGDRHDGRRHQRADADGGERDADEPGREAMQEQRRHREIVAELLEPRGEFRRRADAGRDREEADHDQQAEHDRIARQHRGVAADGVAARRAQNAGDRMWIEKQRQRRADGKRHIDPVSASAVGRRSRQQDLGGRHRGEDLGEAAELDRHHDDGGDRRDVDQDILDDGDRGRRPQAARIGECRENQKRDDQRQIAQKARAGNAEPADHHLQADQLQRDIRHGGDDARDGDRQRQPAIAVRPRTKSACVM